MYAMLRLRLMTDAPGASDEFQRLLAAGDADAMRIYRGQQERSLGADPLAVACV